MDGLLTDAIRRLASAPPDRGFVFLRSDLTEANYAFPELFAAARGRASALYRLGLRKGDRLALVLPDNEDFVLTFLGAVLLGVIPVPMAPPFGLRRLDRYFGTMDAILRIADVGAVATTPRLASVLAPVLETGGSGRRPLVIVDLGGGAAAADVEDTSLTPDDVCFLQFTSGSTATPRGVIVRHRNLAANVRAILFEGLGCDAQVDRGVSWLPLYHDMGLIGVVLASLFIQLPLVLIPNTAFMKNPRVWMATMSRYRGSLTFAPAFAFALAADRATPEDVARLDLRSVRVIGCGGEAINAPALRRFAGVFAGAGLDERAIMPAYGMAEATLAITFHPRGTPLRTERVDRDLCERENVASPVAGDAGTALEVVSCGRTFQDHELAVVSSGGERLPERRVGEIVVRGPSVTTGYYNDEEASRTIDLDGWLRTGDLGFLADGDLFVCGRSKDLMVIHGRNCYPEALERVVEELEGIRAGHVVAFSVPGPGGEEIVLMAETKTGAADRWLAETIRREIRDRLGHVVEHLVFVAAGALPKTSSGKVQRQRARAEYLDGRPAGQRPRPARQPPPTPLSRAVN